MRTFNQTRFLLVLSLAALLQTHSFGADTASSRTEGLLNRLLAPGPLILGHDNLEQKDCLKCHTPKEGVPTEKCLACHKEIRPSVEEKKGFHGLTKKTCASCHGDHHGREFDTTRVDQKKFDHKTTGFSLSKRHAKLKCTQCHQEKRSAVKKHLRPDDPHYLGLKVTCISCHKKHDVHFFEGVFAQKDCNACHSPDVWKGETRFDHEKDGKFKLVGKHEKMKCAKCHVPSPQKIIYKWPEFAQKQCVACHKNPHENKIQEKHFEKNCVGCHNQETWKLPKLDHKKISGYPLLGKHAQLKCVQCHKQTPAVLKEKNTVNFKWMGLKQECLSCHKNVHKNEQMNSCNRCHTEESWKKILKFSHDKTRFPLREKHIKVPCAKCHIPVPGAKGVKEKDAPRIYQWPNLPEMGCKLCHKTPHEGRFSPKTAALNCNTCHNETNWKTFVPGKFDHTRDTRFPLKEKHAQAPCIKCHIPVPGSKGPIIPKIYQWQTLPEKNCKLCHKSPHDGKFSKKFENINCLSCHNETSWKTFVPGKFDHNKETRFQLAGKHLKKVCQDCHKAGKAQVYVFQGADSNFCKECHKTPHTGQFSKTWSDAACSVCHSSENFTQRLDFDHNKIQHFKLANKHAKAPCIKCHKATTEPLRIPAGPNGPGSGSAMVSKYRSKFVFPEMVTQDCATCHKDVHKGSFGAKCSQCHNDKHWKQTADFHKNFTLSGVHYTLDCDECHQDNRRLGGMSERCVACHRKDDVHLGALPKCGECHTQQFWDMTEFKHSLTEFPLRGIHRTLDCRICHENGLYKGTRHHCGDCHGRLAEALPSHATLRSRHCDDCHNQFLWKR